MRSITYFTLESYFGNTFYIICSLHELVLITDNSSVLFPSSVVTENIASTDEAAPTEFEGRPGVESKGKESTLYFDMKPGTYASQSQFIIFYIFAYHAMSWLHGKGIFESSSMC